jgi:hypothetical protein
VVQFSVSEVVQFSMSLDSSLRMLQRRMGEWRIAHAEQVVGQQMGAIRDQENSQLNSKKPMPAGRQLDG